MRVSTTALASLPALLFFASCVTPPPMNRPASTGGMVAGPAAHPERSSRYNGRSTSGSPSGSSSSVATRPLAPAVGRLDNRASEWTPDRASDRLDDRRFDDGRYNLRWAGGTSNHRAPAPVVVDRDRDHDQRRYEDSYTDPVPPHERAHEPSHNKGHLSFSLGGRDLDDEQFRGAEEPINFGLEFSQATVPGQIGFEGGIACAIDSEDDVFFPNGFGIPTGVYDVERDTFEIYGGVRTEFELDAIRPYLGAGLVVLNMTEHRKQGFIDSEDDDTDVGGYFHCGFHYDVDEQFYVGFDFRRVFGTEMKLYGDRFDSDYGQFSFVLGITL